MTRSAPCRRHEPVQSCVAMAMMAAAFLSAAVVLVEGSYWSDHCFCGPGYHVLTSCDPRTHRNRTCAPCPAGQYSVENSASEYCDTCEQNSSTACYVCALANVKPQRVECSSPTPPPPFNASTPPANMTSPSSPLPPSSQPTSSTASTTTSTSPHNTTLPPTTPTIHHSVSAAAIGICCSIAIVMILVTCLPLTRLILRYKHIQRLKAFCQMPLNEYLRRCRDMEVMRWQNQTVYDLMNRRDTDRLLHRWATSCARCPVHGDQGLHPVSLHQGFRRRCSCIISSNALQRQTNPNGGVRFVEDLSVLEAMLLAMHLDEEAVVTRPPWHVIFDIYSDPLLTVGMVDEISVRGSTPPQQSSQSPTFELLVHLAGHPRRFTVPKLGRGLIDGGFEEAACCLDYVEDDGTVPQDCGESTPRHSRRNSNCSEVTVPIPPDPPSQHTTSPWDPARVAKNLAQRYPSTAPSAKENALLQLVQGTERFFRRNGQQRPRKVWSRQREIIGSQSDLLNNASDSEPDDLDEIHGAPNPTYDDYPFRTPAHPQGGNGAVIPIMVPSRQLLNFKPVTTDNSIATAIDHHNSATPSKPQMETQIPISNINQISPGNEQVSSRAYSNENKIQQNPHSRILGPVEDPETPISFLEPSAVAAPVTVIGDDLWSETGGKPKATASGTHIPGATLSSRSEEQLPQLSCRPARPIPDPISTQLVNGSQRPYVPGLPGGQQRIAAPPHPPSSADDSGSDDTFSPEKRSVLDGNGRLLNSLVRRHQIESLELD